MFQFSLSLLGAGQEKNARLEALRNIIATDLLVS